MTESIRDVLSEVNDFYGCGSDLEMGEVLKMAEIARLDRIAATLEGIEQSLSNIDQSLDALTELSDCISMTNGGLSKIFCITGNVSTHEW